MQNRDKEEVQTILIINHNEQGSYPLLHLSLLGLCNHMSSHQFKRGAAKENEVAKD